MASRGGSASGAATLEGRGALVTGAPPGVGHGTAAGRRARAVNVASDAHKCVPRGFDFDDPMSERGFRFPTVVTGLRVYGMSKLANILFTTELARRLEGTRVTANAVHPGGVATRLGTNTGMFAKITTALMRPFFKTPEQGAATSLYVATSPDVARTNGRYCADS